jgi:hypothetical protein
MWTKLVPPNPSFEISRKVPQLESGSIFKGTVLLQGMKLEVGSLKFAVYCYILLTNREWSNKKIPVQSWTKWKPIFFHNSVVLKFPLSASCSSRIVH